MADRLKGERGALDTSRGMRMQDLKLRVERADYIVEPAAVAEAMLRHAVSYRRCWNPRAVWAMPPECSSTPGRPSWTAPIHVSGTWDSAA